MVNHFNFIFTFVVFTFSIILSFFVWQKNKQGVKNIVYFLFSSSLSLWLLLSVLADYFKLENYALLCAQLAMVLPPIVISSVLHFAIIFPDNTRKYPWWVYFFVYFPVFIIEPFVFSSYNIKEYKVEDWGFSYQPGSLFVVLIFLMLVYISISLYILVKKFLVSSGIAREQIRFFLLAVSLGALVGIFSNGVFPLLGLAQTSIFGPAFSVLIVNILIAYAIIRYRLMSIRVVLQKIITSTLLFIIFYFILYFIYKIESITYFYVIIPTFVKIIVSSLVIAIVYHRIEDMIIRCTNKFFAKGNYDYSEIMHRIADITASSHDLGIMLNKSLELVSRSLGAEKVVFLLHDNNFKNLVNKKKYSVDNQRFKQLSLASSSSLARYMIKEKNVVISEELEIKLRNNMVAEEDVAITQNTIKELKDYDIYLCQPLIKNEQLTAAICFGEKKSGDSYSIEDIKLINTFADQLGLGIENRLAFEELKNKKEQLEKSMKLMVGRELDMINMKKELNNLKVNQ